MHYLSLFLRSFLIALLFLGTLSFIARLPPQSVPWGTLDLRAPLGLFTTHKLASMRDDMPICHTALSRAEIEFTPLPELTAAGACTLQNMAVLDRSLYPYSATVRANCALLAALTVWERQVVKPAASKYLQADITQIDHVGIFACRNVRGSSSRRSQHASASAIDIQGFRTEDGRMIDIETHWGEDTPEGRFLHAVHDGACRVFRGVLGPEYNELHRDHFHLDLGPYNICR